MSVDSTNTVTLSFRVVPGTLVVEGESPTGGKVIVANELSQAIVGAVADEHRLDTADGVTRFRITKTARRPLG